MIIDEARVSALRDNIFQLALKSPDLETMHWYIALDNCFENDGFPESEIGNMVWRCRVLSWKGQPVSDIAWQIDGMIKDAGYTIADAGDILKTHIVKVAEGK